MLHQSARSILPALMNKTQRYLKSSAWGSNSWPTRREQFTHGREPWPQTWKCWSHPLLLLLLLLSVVTWQGRRTTQLLGVGKLTLHGVFLAGNRQNSACRQRTMTERRSTDLRDANISEQQRSKRPTYFDNLLILVPFFQTFAQQFYIKIDWLIFLCSWFVLNSNIFVLK